MEKLPQTIEGVCRQKRRFMWLLRTAPTPKQKELFARAVNHCDRLTARITARKKRCLRFFALLLCLCFMFIGGCSAGVGVGADYDIYYPKKEWVKADGTSGKSDDPAGSRKQATRHGVSMQRNNELPRIGGSN